MALPALLGAATLLLGEPWRLDETGMACTVTRRYEQPAALRSEIAIEASLGGELSLLALVPRGEIMGSPQTLTVGSAETQRVLPIERQIVGADRIFLRARITANDMAALPENGVLPFESMALSYDGLPAAVKIARSCVANRISSWGLNPAPYLDGTMPESVRGSYFDPTTFPREAIRRGAEGPVAVVLTISEEGKVANCRVVQSANTVLDAGTCRAVRGMRYRRGVAPPANYSIVLVRWVLPAK